MDNNPEQQQQPVDSYQQYGIPSTLGDNPYAYPSYVRKDELANVIKQTDPSMIVDELLHSLRGEVWSDPNQTWERKFPALMNEKGIQRFSNLMRSFITLNTTLSNLDNKEIMRQIYFFGTTVINLITIRWKDFEIDRGDFDLIKAMLINMAFFTLKRAFQQGEREFIQPMLQSRESISYMAEGAKPSFWQRFKL